LAKNNLSGTFELYPWITTCLIAKNIHLVGIVPTGGKEKPADADSSGEATMSDEGQRDLDVVGTQLAVGGPMSGHSPINVLPRLASVQQLLKLATIPVLKTSGKLVLKKRLLVASFPTSYGTFTCSTHSMTGSPYQDCINTIAAFCQETSPLFSGWSNCHSKILTMRNELNANWKNYINSCAKFAGGSPKSIACKDATYRINTQEVYYYFSGGILQTAYVPESLTRSAAYIWNT